MSRGTPTGPNMVKDLQGQLKKIVSDLRERSEQPEDAWAQQLRGEYDAARHRGRTALTWSEWRDGEIDLAATRRGVQAALQSGNVQEAADAEHMELTLVRAP